MGGPRAVPVWASNSSQIVPAGPATTAEDTQVRVRSRSDRLRRCSRAIVALTQTLWKSTQIEYNGHYSLEKALYLLRYRQSCWRQCGLILFSPWACLVIALLSELIPLEDPSKGWRGCPNFWARMLFRSTAFNVSVLASVGEPIPQISISWARLVLLSAGQAIGFIVSIIAFAELFGVFPVPFCFFVVAPLYMGFAAVTHLSCIWRVLFNADDPAGAKKIRQRFAAVTRVNNFGPLVLLAYAGYATIFQRVDNHMQWALAAALQLLKTGAKRGMWLRAQIAPGGDDLAGEHVISSAHFFHALFSALSLQVSKSMTTLALLVGWNLVYDLLAMNTLLSKTKAVETLWQRVPQEKRVHGKASLIESTIRSLHEPKKTPATTQTDDQQQLPIQSSYWRHHAAVEQLMTTGSTVSSQQDGGGDGGDSPSSTTQMQEQELAWLRETSHLFHVREMILLRFYVDIFVPCIYLFFALALKRLPNIQYFAVLDTANSASLTNRIAVQISCKVVAFAVMLALLARQRRQRQWVNGPHAQGRMDQEPSALQHLGFVLYAHRYTFQFKLLVIGLVVLDFPLTHLGNDLTFRFNWVQNEPTPAL